MFLYTLSETKYELWLQSNSGKLNIKVGIRLPYCGSMTSELSSPSLPGDKSQQVGEEDYGFLDYRNISRIRLGRYEFDTWYGNSALFIQTSSNSHMLAYKGIDQNIKPIKNLKKHDRSCNRTPWLDTLFVCPHCFKFSDIEEEINKHIVKCVYKKDLPGKVMYNDRQTVIRKVRGMNHRLFCQCMCLLAKFFLDNKSVFYFLDHYDFFVAYQKLDGIEIPMGFYSKELLSWEANNLSCICVIPCYQKQHLGTKLIDFSYKLSNYEQQISGPERPLSLLGKMSYLRYWCKKIALSFVYGDLSTRNWVTLELISQSTGFKIDDLLMALDFMKVLYESSHKDPKMDYYCEEFKTRDEYVFLVDGNFKVYLDKFKLKKWILDNKVLNEPILEEKYLVLY